MTRRLAYIVSVALPGLLLAYSVSADVKNPVMAVGQQVFNATPGAPLITDANNQLASGQPATTYVGSSASINVATNAAYATMTGSTISPPLAGVYKVTCRGGTITHSTNNADTFLAVHVAGTIVSDSIVTSKSFIQGGVTPSLSIPNVLSTDTEVTITAAQAITCGWRTSAGTAVSPNSHSISISRVR